MKDLYLVTSDLINLRLNEIIKALILYNSIIIKEGNMHPDELPDGEAERLVKHPIIVNIFDDLEKEAMEIAIHSKPKDDETRRTCMNEIRAIRSLRQKLTELAQGKVKVSVKGNVA